MSPPNEETIAEDLNLTPYVPKEVAEMTLTRLPTEVLAEAQKAAAALKSVIDSKPRKVQFNGETYLEFEDWQTIGRFYGITSKVVTVQPVIFPREPTNIYGFQAKAIAVTADGREIAAAESMCLTDEPNWAAKPLFQLSSMAQTRAQAKSLRSVLSWIAVLAGYRPTPAEEMTGTEKAAVAAATNVTMPQRKAPGMAAPAPQALTGNGGETGTVSGAIKTIHKDQKKIRGNQTDRWQIVMENGVVVETLNADLANSAQAFAFAGEYVRIAYKRTQWANDLLTLEPAEEHANV